MRPRPKSQDRLRGVIGIALLAALAMPALARDAAFMDPGGSNNSDEAVQVEPKGNIDTGESEIGVAKRTTVFFVNQTGLPVQVEKVSVNSDGNVAAEASNDDCTKQATIAPQSRCSVEVSVTPSSPGPWSVDVLMTHNGAGRIARGKLSGKTTGVAGGDKKESGLAVSGKETTPVAFGDVAGGGKAVRSALMINDSADPITIYSIDVIEADNGLTRLEKGCAVDMELKPGESCPVTLLWAPTDPGQISTDLIIRHSGRLGFSVIPIRGTAKGGVFSGASTTTKSSDKVVPVTIADVTPPVKETKEKDASKDIPPPPPPSTTDVDKAVEKVASSALAEPAPEEGLRLIGTVGSRGIFLKADGTTAIAGTGDEIENGTGKTVTVAAISPKSADIMIKDRKKTLRLQASADLLAKAAGSSSHKEVSAMPIMGATPSSTPSPAPAAAAPASTIPPISPGTIGTPK